MFSQISNTFYSLINNVLQYIHIKEGKGNFTWNYLAGYNAANGIIVGVGIIFDTFQKLVGALHIKGAAGERLSTSEKLILY